MKLPIPTKDGAKKATLIRPSSRQYLACYQSYQSGKPFTAILELLRGTKIGDRTMDTAELKALPLVSAEVLVLQLLKEQMTEQKLSGVYSCPECHTRLPRRKEDDEDNRIDLSTLTISYAKSYDEAKVVLDIKEPADHILLRFKQNPEAGRLHGWTYDVFTLGDLIQVQDDRTLKDDARRMSKLLFMNLEDLRGEYSETHPGDFTDAMKNRYKHDIFNYPNIDDWLQIQDDTRKYGLDMWTPDLGCENCNHVWKEPIDFTAFFGSALLSISQGRARQNGHHPPVES